ncbi:hypothetical protein [Pseudomonas denitrificans (nom. rej.)]|uniref:hypothetical protein n=1 Tax=Pseudomonas denitrificans TaxID=43306 RepID=UPI00142EEF3A|nr:hypothetical protein [Pseudomonas denitrificans (nom. rej.)]
MKRLRYSVEKDMVFRPWRGAIMPCRQQKRALARRMKLLIASDPMNAANRTFQQIITTIVPMVG